MMPQRSLVTVLFTDIVGSTERASELGDHAWHEVLEQHHARVRGELKRFGGREVATAGDGFLAVFDEPGQAMLSAWAVRDAVREGGVEIRCGVHMGAVDHVAGNVGGIGVHIAARVLGEADAGEILVSQTVHDSEAGSGFVFKDRGSRPLKGVSGEWRLFSLKGVPERVSTGHHGALFRRSAEKRGFLVGAAVALVVVLLIAAVYVRSGDEAVIADSQTRFDSAAVTHRQVTFTGDVFLADASPDGNTIAYVSRSRDDMVLYLQDLSGGEPLEIGRFDFAYHLRWSPTGDYLLVSVWREGAGVQLLLFPRLGGSPRELPGAPLFAWSPDGGQYVSGEFVGPEKRLWFRDISTGDSTSITLPDSFTVLYDIEWSPSGNQIALLTRDDPSTWIIWTIDKTGEAPQSIIQETQEGILSIRWSKTGDGIYFLRTHGDVRELVRMDVSPSIGEPSPSQEVVLSGLTASDFDLLDGNGRILYHRSEFFGDLWIVEPRSSGEAEIDRLTSGTAGKWHPSVSPDGRRIAFMMSSGSVSNIYVLPLEGGAMKRITYLQSATCPVWSPDGSEIAFISEEEGRARVWKVTADGGMPKPYPSTDVTRDFSPCLAWAPGDKVLYQRRGNRILYQLDAETGEEIPLVSNTEVGWMRDAVYSPDGTKVAVRWVDRPDGGTWIISLMDGKQERIRERDKVFPLGWSPDEEWFYGYKVNPDSLQIVRYSMADHSAGVVATVQCGRNVQQLVMTPDARRFVCAGGELQADLWIAENVNLTGRMP